MQWLIRNIISILEHICIPMCVLKLMTPYTRDHRVSGEAVCIDALSVMSNCRLYTHGDKT